MASRTWPATSTGAAPERLGSSSTLKTPQMTAAVTGTSVAGVHKTTVYRRWLTKAALTADAASLKSADAVPIPDTGTLAEDLRMLAREVVSNIGTDVGARRYRSIAAASATSDELTTAMHGFWAERLTLSAVIVERAIERGELPASSDANLIIEAVIGPLWVRLLLTGEPITEALADQAVEIVTRGITRR